MAGAIPLFLGVGALAGFLAGLFGVGGGVVIVPMLVLVFGRQGVGESHLMHLALGTSLASIVFTSISSFSAHHRRGAVVWDAVRRIAPGILAGTFAGAFIAARLRTGPLRVFFVAFLALVIWQLLSDRRPEPARDLPGPAGMTAAGAGIGVVSSLVGIGGGSLSVPFLIWCNIPPHRAVGTSAAIGFPIAVAGAVGYLANGWAVPGLPPYSAGYVSLPALAGIAVASVLTAPLGARLAHALPVRGLKRAFALFLIVMAARMAWGVLR